MKFLCTLKFTYLSLYICEISLKNMFFFYITYLISYRDFTLKITQLYRKFVKYAIVGGKYSDLTYTIYYVHIYNYKEYSMHFT